MPAATTLARKRCCALRYLRCAVMTNRMCKKEEDAFLPV